MLVQIQRGERPALAFGGLSRAGLETLIRRYQAGGIDLGTFLLTHEGWEPDGVSPALLWAGAAFLDTLLRVAAGAPAPNLRILAAPS